MNDAELGGIVRALRHRRSWRQSDLSDRAGVSPGMVGLIERGRADRVSVRGLRAVTGALEIRLSWDVGFRGPELARLRDADHARLAEQLCAMLESCAWLVAAETSYNRFGDRGRIDLLAYHPVLRVLLVIEVKTVLAEVQQTLGALSVKRRVAADVAREHGWQPIVVVGCLAIVESSTNRRRVAAHDRLFGEYSLRGRALRGWLRNPIGRPQGALLFIRLPDRSQGDGRRAGRQRVRVRAASSRVKRTSAPAPKPSTPG